MAKNKLNLLADFPPVSTQEWMDKIIADLKGADFDKKLVWKTNEGFNVRPFYRAEDTENLEITNLMPGEFPYVRGTKTDNEWYVRQDIKVEDAKAANAKALDILNKGITSLGFRLKKADISAGFIATLLNGIDAEAVELNFESCIQASTELATILADYFKSKGYNADKLNGSINFDPMNRMLLKGKNLSEEIITEKAVSVINAVKALPNYRVINVNGLSLTNAGAHITQELGYSLSWGNQYLAMLTDAGINAEEAAKRIRFNFGVGSNYFMEIAKFRAARMLWALIVQKYTNNNGDATKMHMHAETTTFNMTIFDANVNMLRTQTEAMSATIAGVDSLTVLGYDYVYKPTDDFSERIARNQQLLLKEESHFDKVTDPSGGSYYIETLTEEIAKQAWKIFIAVEEGGFLAAIKGGIVQKIITETANARLRDISSRKEVLLGTNQFPNFTETAAQKVEYKDGKCACGCSSNEEKEIDTLPCVRGGEEFEELRFATENAAKTPKVFMLTIGNLAMRLARAQFSSNFFACAGYEIIDNLGFETVADGVKAAEKANADIIVLCSSDDEYETLAPEAYELAKDKYIFVVAGAPASMEDLKAKGITNFINVRTNVLDTLKGFNKELGI